MQVRHWFKKTIISFIFLFISVSLVGVVFEKLSRSKAENQIKPVGQFMDIGHHKLHYVKKGTGSPSVIFESGLEPGGHLSWSKVQNEVSRFATTVSYDRAGLMWSERGNNPKTAPALASELHALLEKLDIEKPYILVGHSMAGLILPSFIDQYPHEVSHIIFVDASHPTQNKRLGQTMDQNPLWLMDFLNSTGVIRLLTNRCYENLESDDPINQQAKAMMFKGMRAYTEESNAYPIFAREADTIDSFGGIPLTIITAHGPDEIWNDLQEELLTLSTISRRLISNQGGHYVQLDDPQVIIGVIKENIESRVKPLSIP